MLKKKIIIYVSSIFVLLLVLVGIFVVKNSSLQGQKLTGKEDSTSTGSLVNMLYPEGVEGLSLSYIIDKYKKNPSNISEKIKKDFSNARSKEAPDGGVLFFIYLCQNPDEVKRYYEETSGKDEDLLSFLNTSSQCRYSLLDGMYSLGITSDKKLRDSLYNDCKINKKETEENGSFDRDFRPLVIIMTSYFKGIDTKEVAIEYLKKFASISDINQKKYYQFLERDFAQMYIQVLNGKKMNEEECIGYLKKDQKLIDARLNPLLKKNTFFSKFFDGF